jgi:hypothetical protein
MIRSLASSFCVAAILLLANAIGAIGAIRRIASLLGLE